MDFRVSARQQIGSWWTPRRDDLAVCDEILSGRLNLSPHPTWEFGKVVDWGADPFSQRNWRFQLHSMKWLDPVRRVGLLDIDMSQRCRDFWCETIFAWSDQFLEGDDEYAWMDMADGLRAIELVLGAPIVPDDRLQSFEEVAMEHLRRLSDLGRRVPGNHGLHQVQGMLVAAAFLEDSQALKDSLRQLKELFHSEYDSQGTNKEGSLAYHDLNYHWWKSAAERVHVEGLDFSECDALLEKSRSNLMHFVRPDGFLETIGDTPPERTLSADGYDFSTYAQSGGEQGMPPVETCKVLDGGFIAGRSSWGEDPESFKSSTFYSLRFGEEAIHGHDDGGSITLFFQNPWIVDPGMYAYQRHPMRNYFKGRSAHNSVESSDPSFFDGATTLAAAYSGPQVDWYELQTNAASGGKLTRWVIYLKKFNVFFVLDRLSVAARATNGLEFWQNWHFMPEIRVEVGLRTVVLMYEGNAATLRWLNRPKFRAVRGEQDPLKGWYSPRYGESVPTTALEVIPSASAPHEWFAAISLGNDDVIPVRYWFEDEYSAIQFKVDEKYYLLDLTKGQTPRLFVEERI